VIRAIVRSGGYSAAKVIICDAIKTWDYKLCRAVRRVRDSSAIMVNGRITREVPA